MEQTARLEGWRSARALWVAFAFVLALALAGMALLLPAPAAAQGLQPVPPLSARVVDTIGLLGETTRADIEARLAALEREKGTQVAFLVVATTAPEDIASYANRVGNAWKIGRQGVGDGVLLVVARDDRRVRIEVAKTLEGAIPDLAARRIIEEAITPAFRQGDYGAGLQGAADRISALVRGEALPAPRPAEARSASGFDLADLAVFLFIAVPVLAAILRGIFGRKAGSVLAGGAAGAIAWLASASVAIAVLAALVGLVLALAGGLAPMVRHGRRGGWGAPGVGGGWAGGAGGGWSGGTGSGGFSSGGGGDFGGGGASGDW